MPTWMLRCTRIGELLLYINLAAILVSDYTSRLSTFLGMSQHDWLNSNSFVQEVATGNGIEPYRSRVLVPFMLVGISRSSSFTPFRVDLGTAHWIYYVVCLTLIMFVTQRMLESLGYSRSAGVVGGLLVGGLLPIALRDHGYQAWSWLEWCLVPAAIWLARKQAATWLIVLLSAIAALNRETAILIPLALIAVAASDSGRSKGIQPYVSSIASLATVGAVLAVLKVIWPGPGAAREITLQAVHQTNLVEANIYQTMINVGLLLGALSLLSLIGLATRHVPKSAVYVAIAIIPPTLAYWLYFALWWEVRVLGPVVIALVPLAISGLGMSPRPQEGHENQHSSSDIKRLN